MDECLDYFRMSIADPRSVPPWSEWWAANVGLVERTFPLLDYVRLKHRRLLGARQILQHRGELPEDYTPPSARETGSCGQCGERVTILPVHIICPVCGGIEERYCSKPLNEPRA